MEDEHGQQHEVHKDVEPNLIRFTARLRGHTGHRERRRV